jgi:hypothetical protein
MGSAKPTRYLLSDIGGKPRGLDAIISASTAPNDICPAPRRSRKLRNVGRSVLNSGTIVLNSVTDYLYREAQECRTSEERDSFSLALAICGAVRRGEPNPVSSAAYTAFGSTLDKYVKRRAHKTWLQHQELLRCVPDYDPCVVNSRTGELLTTNREASNANVEQKSEVRRQEARVGNLYEMPSKKKPSQPQPVRRMPRKSAVD